MTWSPSCNVWPCSSTSRVTVRDMFLIGDTQRSSSSTPTSIVAGSSRRIASWSGWSSSASMPSVMTWRLVSSPPIRISRLSWMIDSSSSRSPSISASHRMLTRSSCGARPAVGDHAELELAEREHRLEPGVRDLRRRIGGRRADQVVGPAQQVVVRLGREAEHVGDEQQRQRRGDVPHEVALPLRRDAVDDLRADAADRRLVIAHAPRREPAAHELAPARVLGIVHRDHHREVVAVRTRRAVARERRRILLDREHVVVAGQRPDLVLRVPVRGRVLAHPRPVGERLARVPAAVEQIEVARHGRRMPSCARGLHPTAARSHPLCLDISSASAARDNGVREDRRCRLQNSSHAIYIDARRIL